MKRKGWHDGNVADEIGISRVQISRIRRGIGRASASTAMRLAALTNIPWHHFVSPPEPKRAKRKRAA